MSDAVVRRERSYRGISIRLAREYLVKLGGDAVEDDRVAADAWSASLSAQKVSIGPTLTLTEVTVAFEGEPETLDPLIERFSQKAIAPLPLDGDVLLYAGATASVGPERIEPLLRTVQAHLRERRGAYRRRYESAFEDDERRVLLVPTDHWASLGDELGLPDREVDAARRAHAQQLKRIGSKTDRREEFETALEIRGAVVIGKFSMSRTSAKLRSRARSTYLSMVGALRSRRDRASSASSANVSEYTPS